MPLALYGMNVKSCSTGMERLMSPTYGTKSPVHMTNKILSCTNAWEGSPLTVLWSKALEASNCSMNLEVWLQDRQTLSDCIDRSQIPVFPSSYISPHFFDICNGKRSVCFRKWGVKWSNLFGMIFSEFSVPFFPNWFDCDEEFKPLELFLSTKYGTWNIFYH